MYLTFTALATAVTFKFTNITEYSINGGEWIELAANTNTPELNSGDTIRWRSVLEPTATAGIGTFSSTGDFSVSGSPFSLLYGSSYTNQSDLLNDTNVFYALFKNAVHLIDAQNIELASSSLTLNCYREMFSGCTNLATTPELPVTTLAEGCYANMFDVCTSLTTAPELPATILAKLCYSGMFHGCTSLVDAPELHATILAESCYSDMFIDCTSLVAAPDLPATILAEGCYANMFEFCTSLTTPPKLSAATLKNYCYEYMFSGCTSLVNAPELPATALVTGCYDYMFYNCTSLNYIKAMFTTIPSTSYTDSWVNGVASEGTFVKNSSANWNVTGDNGIPVGWGTKVATINTYTDIDLNFLYDGSPISLLDIKNASEHDEFENNVGWTPSSHLNSIFIVNNFYRTCPWAGEENFWKQIVNDEYVRFTDNDYNSFFKNTYSEYANIAYVLNDYTSWEPYTAQNDLPNDLFAYTSTISNPSIVGPGVALWPLESFKISDLLGISLGILEFPRSSSGISYNIGNRNYNNITLFLIMMQTYMMLSKNVERECDYNKEIRVLGEEFLNNISIDITKTVCCCKPWYPKIEYDTNLLSNIYYEYFFYYESTANHVEFSDINDEVDVNSSDEEKREYIKSLTNDINIISTNGNLSYRILFPLIMFNSKIKHSDIHVKAYSIFTYCSWVMEISYPSNYTITINDIKWGLNHMYGNKHFLVNDALSPSIQGIYVNYQPWSYSKYIDSELKLRYSTDTNKMYIHFINRNLIGQTVTGRLN